MKQCRKTALVAGGDLRYVYTAHALAERFDVYAAGFSAQDLPFPEIKLAEDEFPACDILVLPMPVSDDGVFVNALQGRISLEALAACVRPDGVVCGGKFGKAAEIFRKANLPTADYFESEELTVLNAVPTAEGALEILLSELPCTICGSRMLILGYGRIASRLASSLCALGADVTVAARDPVQRTWAELSGCSALPLADVPAHAAEFQVICNTIPAKVITAEVLRRMQADALILDLASKPGGVDLDAAQKYGRHVVWALSLPGKTAPVTAGEIIARTIFHLLEERGVSS